ncbi:hypothetical protein GCM10027215_13900 [Nocardioides zeae]
MERPAGRQRVAGRQADADLEAARRLRRTARQDEGDEQQHEGEAAPDEGTEARGPGHVWTPRERATAPRRPASDDVGGPETATELMRGPVKLLPGSRERHP